ncbi:MAG: cobalt-precorrin-5B (C(1))-methyltransferase CbiD [Rikenellaceae bacterium]
MILIFGGTTEGRVAASVCDIAGKEYLYSTKGEEQKLVATCAKQIHGAADAMQMAKLFKEREISLIIDAAHPYAEILHENITTAAEELKIPVVRFERLQQDVSCEGTLRFNNMAEVARYIKYENIRNVLALTGVKSAAEFVPIAKSNGVMLRVMDREESLREIERANFPAEKVLFYDLLADSDQQALQIEAICRENKIKAIVTKESGRSGGFAQKVAMAQKLGVALLVVERPALPVNYAKTVYGEFGLRRAIEQLLPKHFEMRSGFTTGSAATAATVAALRVAVGCANCSSECVAIELPNGEPIDIAVANVIAEKDGVAKAVVVKDGGDDPDATHNLEIVARVKFISSPVTSVKIVAGEGVGRVTLPGIGIAIGEGAINPVPRAMIERNVAIVLSKYGVCGSVEVTIEVPKGAEVGAKSFNPRLGILGGISILGTSGIVQPFSAEAFLQSIEQQVRIVKALGEKAIVINSGAMSEGYVKAYRDDLPAQCYIHYGNLVGATIELAAQHDLERVTIGCMVGKAVKLAAGHLDTHSKSATIDREFIAELATEANCSSATIAKIAGVNTARELWSAIPREDYALMQLIAQRCFDHCKPLLPNGTLEFLLISDSGAVEASVVG